MRSASSPLRRASASRLSPTRSGSSGKRSASGQLPRPPLPDLFKHTSVADFVTALNAVFGLGATLNAISITIEAHVAAAAGGRTAVEVSLEGWRLSFVLLMLGLLCDILDGFIARTLRCSSPFGGDLDSLADLLTFGVAPAILGWCAGLNGFLDCLIFLLFVVCGVGRLARYNVTADVLSEGTGKVSYYEGIPIPATLLLLGLLWGELERNGRFDGLVESQVSWQIPTGLLPSNILAARTGGPRSTSSSRSSSSSSSSMSTASGSTVTITLHHFTLLYLLAAGMLVSKLQIPKPGSNCQKRNDAQRDLSVQAKHRIAEGLKECS